jgi:hypothetical protein
VNLSRLFIFRPVATTLLTLAIALAGMIAFRLLPVAPLPQVEYPTISVSASLPGASPEVMAATVAGPLERVLGQIAGVTEMTSNSTLGSTRVTLQFDLSRSIDGAAREVQAAINAARSQLPTSLPSNPTYRKVNPADSPILIVALTSATLARPQMYDAASTVLAQRLAQVDGVGQVSIGGSSLPAVRVELDPTAWPPTGSTSTTCATLVATNANRPKGVLEGDEHAWQVGANDQARRADDYRQLIVSWKNGSPVHLSDVARVRDGEQDERNYGYANGRPAVLLMIYRQPGANIIETVDRVRAAAAALGQHLAGHRPHRGDGPHAHHPRLAQGGRAQPDDLGGAGGDGGVPVPAQPAGHADPGRRGAGVADRHLRGDVPGRLQPRQPVADGPHHRHRLCRRRRHRGAREHRPPRGRRHVAAPRGAQGRAGDRLHGAVDEPVADRRLHPHPGDGRHRRAAVPRVRGHAVGGDPGVDGDLPHRHADDVRAPLRRRPPEAERGRFDRLVGGWLDGMAGGYRRSLGWALARPWLVLAVLAATIGSNVYLYNTIPKGFFPQQDTGRVRGFVEADQAISFQAMRGKMDTFWPSSGPTRRWPTSPASPAARSATTARCSSPSSPSASARSPSTR